MKYIEVVADAGDVDTVAAIAEKVEARDFRLGLVGEDGLQSMRLLISDNKIQITLDRLQKLLNTQTNARISVGIALAIFLSLLIGVLWPFDSSGPELMARTKVGLDSVVLALVLGAAAAISLTSRSLNVLVGVMVAVALLPPAATIRLMIGHGEANLAIGAGLQLAINIVCVNLAAKVVFYLRGIRPRIWWKKETAKRKMLTYVFMWFVTLVILMVIIFLRGTFEV